MNNEEIDQQLLNSFGRGDNAQPETIKPQKQGNLETRKLVRKEAWKQRSLETKKQINNEVSFKPNLEERGQTIKDTNEFYQDQQKAISDLVYLKTKNGKKTLTKKQIMIEALDRYLIEEFRKL